jgi:hypothetical protein
MKMCRARGPYLHPQSDDVAIRHHELGEGQFSDRAEGVDV